MCQAVGRCFTGCCVRNSAERPETQGASRQTESRAKPGDKDEMEMADKLKNYNRSVMEEGPNKIIKTQSLEEARKQHHRTTSNSNNWAATKPPEPEPEPEPIYDVMLGEIYEEIDNSNPVNPDPVNPRDNKEQTFSMTASSAKRKPTPKPVVIPSVFKGN